MGVINVAVEDKNMAKKIIKLLEVFKSDGVSVIKEVDLDDLLAMRQAKQTSTKRFSLDEAKKELGLDV